MSKKQNFDFTPYIIPVGVIVLGYLVLKRFGLVKDTGQEKQEERQQFADYFSPLYIGQLLKSKSKAVVQAFKQAEAEKIARLIYDSKGYFDDDEELYFGTIKRFKYKSQVSQVAGKFFDLYKRDLATYIRGFLNEEELKKTYNYLNNLPSGLI